MTFFRIRTCARQGPAKRPEINVFRSNVSFRQMSSERKDRRHDPKEESIHHVCEIAVAKTRPVESGSSFRAKDLLNAAAGGVQKMVSKRAATSPGFAGRGGDCTSAQCNLDKGGSLSKDFPPAARMSSESVRYR
jgi:hypothetical protein